MVRKEPTEDDPPSLHELYPGTRCFHEAVFHRYKDQLIKIAELHPD